jgi:hypothetical protein
LTVSGEHRRPAREDEHGPHLTDRHAWHGRQLRHGISTVSPVQQNPRQLSRGIYQRFDPAGGTGKTGYPIQFTAGGVWIAHESTDEGCLRMSIADEERQAWRGRCPLGALEGAQCTGEVTAQEAGDAGLDEHERRTAFGRIN